MKKLLILLLMGLVMGAVFAFALPVHNNGPGLFETGAVFADIASREAVVNYEGIIIYTVLSEYTLPDAIIGGSCVIATPNTVGVFSTQEVMPVSGCSKASEQKMTIFIM